MPELPDVEIYRRYLGATALHRKIVGAATHRGRVLRNASARQLENALAGRSMKEGRRHGKHLLVRLDDGRWLTFHFGMTGRFSYFKRSERDPRHDRLRFDFDNGYHLAFENQRLLGEVGLAEDADAFLEKQELGPDALKIGEAAFRDLLARKRGSLKPALMNQSAIAGMGNVYADEILFQAKLHPADAPARLGAKTVRRLHRVLRETLGTAIGCGAGREGLAERLPKGWLLPHRQEGTPCPRCGGGVRAHQTGGRRGFYCPSCQKGST